MQCDGSLRDLGMRDYTGSVAQIHVRRRAGGCCRPPVAHGGTRYARPTVVTRQVPGPGRALSSGAARPFGPALQFGRYSSGFRTVPRCAARDA